LEKLRFSLLEMAHVEGFNRSPSDVTGARLMKNGLAPVIKQAFEEIYKAPFIVKILLAEVGFKPEKDTFLTVNYDGTFEEMAGWAVLAATPAVQQDMSACLKRETGLVSASLTRAVSSALQAWALGSMAQQRAEAEGDQEAPEPATFTPDMTALFAHLRETVAEKTIECAVMERGAPSSSKYRALTADELGGLLPSEMKG
jgi:proteasome alpha subunit